MKQKKFWHFDGMIQKWTAGRFYTLDTHLLRVSPLTKSYTHINYSFAARATRQAEATGQGSLFLFPGTVFSQLPVQCSFCCEKSPFP